MQRRRGPAHDPVHDPHHDTERARPKRTTTSTPGWIAGHVAVAVAVAVMVNLGFWQLRRLDERRADNARVEALSRVQPAPLRADTPEFRPVTATGTFDTAHDVLVGYRTSQGLPGYHVVTPLVLEGGRAVLVNRGFVPLELADRWPADEAAPPPGPATVVGLVRTTRDGRYPTAPPGRTPRTDQVDVEAIDEITPYDLLPTYLELQEPPPERGFPDPLPPLDLTDGPHRSYAFQWFAFGAVAAVGWIVLVRRRSRAPATRHRSSADSSAAAR